MLYYRLYKGMERKFNYDSGIFPSLPFATFACFIPTAVGFVVAKLFQGYFSYGDDVSFFILMFFIGAATVYIHFCEKRDKDK